MPRGIGTKPVWILIIVFILIVVGIAVANDVFEIKNSGEPTNVLSVGDVIHNAQTYIGKNITVRGYYYQGYLSGGEGYITSQAVEQPVKEGSLENVDYLLINSSSDNITFYDGVLYDFTGFLTLYELTPNLYKMDIFSVKKVEQG